MKDNTTSAPRKKRNRTRKHKDEYKAWRAGVLAECRALVDAGKDIPNDLAQQLLNRFRTNDWELDRDAVIAAYNQWRTELIADGKSKYDATYAAADGALAELKELAKFWGPQVLLDERTVLDRVARKQWAEPKSRFALRGVYSPIKWLLPDKNRPGD
jgi:hypothetical protein